jgi:hypothetical protein
MFEHARDQEPAHDEGAAMKRRFVAVANDPRLIPGVHHYCDEWCHYCPVAQRCLAFRCIAEYRKARGRRESDPTFTSMGEAIALTREISAVEGVSTEDLDALAGGGPGADAMHTEDPLASLALAYAFGVSTVLKLTESEISYWGAPAATPTPREVVIWYHLRIYLKIVRALIGKERTARGEIERSDDAAGCAKLTLVSVTRSREALRELNTPAMQQGVESLIEQLDALERGIDERFPEARAYLRVGLDVPAA